MGLTVMRKKRDDHGVSNAAMAAVRRYRKAPLSSLIDTVLSQSTVPIGTPPARAAVTAPCRGRLQKNGEGGIRTRGTRMTPYNGLANRRLKPLGHLSRLGG